MSNQPTTMPHQYILNSLFQWTMENMGRADLVVKTEKVDNPFVQASAKGGVIVLNIGGNATRNLVINEQGVRFDTRFNTVATHIVLKYTDIVGVRGPLGQIYPIDSLGIYTETSKVLMEFVIEDNKQVEEPVKSVDTKPRPGLKVVK